MPNRASTTTIGIVAIALTIALGGLVGASLGILDVGQDESSVIGYDEVDHGISWIAFCGDADNVTITETWDKEEDDAAAVSYEATGGNISSIVYRGGPSDNPPNKDVLIIDDPDSPLGSFVSGEYNSTDSISPSQQDNPCNVEGIEGDLIDKYEGYTTSDGWD